MFLSYEIFIHVCISGFFDRREFIVAQHPLDSTMSVFWQMVWEQDVHILVMMSSIDPQECRPFWPQESGMHAFFDAGYQKMKVTLLDEVDTASWKAFRISLEVTILNYSIYVRLTRTQERALY